MEKDEIKLSAKQALKELDKKPDIKTLVSASQDGDLDVVKLCLEAGVSVNSFSNNEFLPLNSACVQGHLDIVKVLLDNKADINKLSKSSAKDDGKGFTPLISAILSNKIEVVKFLIEKGADLNKTDDYGGSPILRAYQNKFYEIKDLLIENGVADIEVKQNKESTGYNLNGSILYVVLTIILAISLFLKGYSLKSGGFEYDSGSVLNICVVQMGWFYYLGLVVLGIGCIWSIATGQFEPIVLASFIWFCFLIFIIIAIGFTGIQDYLNGDIVFKNAFKFQYGWYIHFISTLIIALGIYKIKKTKE